MLILQCRISQITIELCRLKGFRAIKETVAQETRDERMTDEQKGSSAMFRTN